MNDQLEPLTDREKIALLDNVIKKTKDPEERQRLKQKLEQILRR